MRMDGRNSCLECVSLLKYFRCLPMDMMFVCVGVVD